MTSKPGNELLSVIVKDRCTAYFMVVRDLNACFREKEAKDVMRHAHSAHGLHIGTSLVDRFSS